MNTDFEILYSYPKPSDNPNCTCTDGAMQFYCPTGHLTECHSGMACDAAQCEHLRRYADGELDHAERGNAPAWLIECRGKPKNAPEEILLLEMMIFAPSPELAKECFNVWISGTQMLSKISLNVRVREFTAEDAKTLCICGHRKNLHSDSLGIRTCENCACDGFVSRESKEVKDGIIEG